MARLTKAKIIEEAREFVQVHGEAAPLKKRLDALKGKIRTWSEKQQEIAVNASSITIRAGTRKDTLDASSLLALLGGETFLDVVTFDGDKVLVDPVRWAHAVGEERALAKDLTDSVKTTYNNQTIGVTAKK